MTAIATGQYQLTRPPRDDDELDALVQALWKITIPRTKVCPEHTPPFQWFADSFFGRAPQTLVHGSRGLSGKSVAMATLGLTEAVVLGADVNLLGGSLAQSMNLHEHMRRAWDAPFAPRYMVMDESNIRIMLSNGARIRPLTASQKTVRGPHPARLLLDEIDEMDYEILQGALGQPMPQKNWLDVPIPAQTAMASTWQNPDGTFAKELKRFQENDLPVYTWCYRESMNPVDGWLDPEFVEQKRREIPAEMWRVEYELGEPSIGNRAIDTDAVERMFAADKGEAVHLSKSHQEYHFEDYRRDSDYVIAADWAKSQDYTVITVWKVTNLPMELVHYVRIHRQPYPKMVGIFNKLHKGYRAEAISDATGLGGVVSDLIDGRTWNFIMAGRDRDDMLTEYVAAVENDKVRAPKIDAMYLEHKYVRNEDLYSRAQEFHLPDTVCSAALAWKVVGGRFPAVAGVGTPKTERNWMARQVETNGDWLKVESSWRADGEVKVKQEDWFSPLDGISL